MILFYLEKIKHFKEAQMFLVNLINSTKKHSKILPKCPKCQSNKFVEPHDEYKRYVCYVNDFVVYRDTITIQRIRCNGCIKTHALLHDDIVPYSHYCKSFIMYCLTKYYIYHESISSISTETNTYKKLIYRFIHTFKDEFFSIILFLKAYLSVELEYDDLPKKIHRLICKIKPLNLFMYEYFNSSKRVFLMRKRSNIITKKNLIGYTSC